MRAPHLGRHGQLGITEPRASRNDDFANARFGAGKNVILSRACGLLEDDEFALFARVFVHHDGVRAARHGRAGQDAHAFTVRRPCR